MLCCPRSGQHSILGLIAITYLHTPHKPDLNTTDAKRLNASHARSPCRGGSGGTGCRPPSRGVWGATCPQARFRQKFQLISVPFECTPILHCMLARDMRHHAVQVSAAQSTAETHPLRKVQDAAILILESSLKTARLWQAVFRLQSREFAPDGRELSALKLILRIAVQDVSM